MNQNGKHRNLAAVDVLDDENQQTEPTAFYDSNSPMLKPAREEAKPKGRSWKRRLIGWSFVLFLIVGGVIALYLLLSVNRVTVRVQADAPGDLQRAKAKDETTNSENNLTAEAINLARTATGSDSGTSHNPNATASPNASPASSPSLQFNGPNLGFTGNNSPVTERFDENNAGDGNQQPNANKMQHQQRSSEPSLLAVSKGRANATQSIFIEDSTKPPGVPLSLTPVSARIDKASPSFTSKNAAPVIPPFGTMLPVRTQGVILTLRNNSYARLEVTRDCSGAGWSLPKGTILVGRTSGSEADRAFVNVVGYIDPRENKFIKMTGDVLGSDGASGISGRRITVDSNRLKQTLRKVALGGVQIAGTLAGALTGRGTIVIDSAGYRLMNPITDDARNALGGGSQKNSFVKVEAGRTAYVMVSDLPKSLSAVDAPGEDDLAEAARSLSDREVMELILFGTSEDIRAALPLMTDDQKRMAMKAAENNQR